VDLLHRHPLEKAAAKDLSSEQTAAALSNLPGIEGTLKVSPREKAILHELAVKVAELAARPVETEKKRLWTLHNDLHPTRPLVFCDPENGWNEIIPQDQIQCEGALFRMWEMALRKEVFWGESMQDDRVIEPYFNIPWQSTDSGYGLAETVHKTDAQGSYTWTWPVKDYETDFRHLRFPEISVDADRTRRIRDVAEEIMGDVLPIRIRGGWWWTLGMTWDFIRLRGLENLMTDMLLHPAWVHRLMDFLCHAVHRKLDFLESHGLLSLNTEGTYVGSGGFGWTTQLPAPGFDASKVRTMDMWGFAESQETVGVSPAMYNEFIFPYQKTILSRFGLNCYGCCEPLDKRWEYVRTFPRLRRVSVSPWSNVERMAELLQGNYIFSLKPSPVPLAQPRLDEDSIRRELRQDLRRTRDCRVEVIMKDNHTLGGNPQNAVRWVSLAKEEAGNL
jgi:hypothetical protein